MAREFEDAHDGFVIVNPRNLYARSMMDFDMDWLNDMALVRKAVQYWLDYPKRPSVME